MTNEQIYCNIAGDLEEKISSNRYAWDSICSVMPLETLDGNYGIIVFCEDIISGEGKCFGVDIRKDFIITDWKDSKTILSERTNTDSYEELEAVIYGILNKFRLQIV